MVAISFDIKKYRMKIEPSQLWEYPKDREYVIISSYPFNPRRSFKMYAAMYNVMKVLHSNFYPKGDLHVRLPRWSFNHAVMMLLATGVFLATKTLFVMFFFAAISFSFLIFMARFYWAEGGGFGSANIVTAFRLTIVFLLPLLSRNIEFAYIAGIGLVLLAADGLDGRLARRNGQSSEFGEYFDKETDAFSLLVLCTLAVLNERLWDWVLILGLLRYVFMIVIHVFKPSFLKEKRSTRASIIYVLVMSAILASFLPFPDFYKPLAVIATTGLVFSFMLDFYLGFSENRKQKLT